MLFASYRQNLAAHLAEKVQKYNIPGHSSDGRGQKQLNSIKPTSYSHRRLIPKHCHMWLFLRRNSEKWFPCPSKGMRNDFVIRPVSRFYLIGAAFCVTLFFHFHSFSSFQVVIDGFYKYWAIQGKQKSQKQAPHAQLSCVLNDR